MLPQDRLTPTNNARCISALSFELGRRELLREEWPAVLQDARIRTTKIAPRRGSGYCFRMKKNHLTMLRIPPSRESAHLACFCRVNFVAERPESNRCRPFSLLWPYLILIILKAHKIILTACCSFSYLHLLSSQSVALIRLKFAVRKGIFVCINHSSLLDSVQTDK